MKRILAALLVLLLLCGCAAKPQETAEEPVEETPTQETETVEADVVLAIHREAGLEPYDCLDPCNRLLFDFIYEPLFVTDTEFEVRPVLAEGWQVSEDGKTTTVTLNANRKFHDGTPVTAEDVCASVEAAENSAFYGSRFADLTAVEAVDSRTVQLTTSVAMECLPRLLDIPITKKEAETPMGSGPYAYHENSLTLVAERTDLPKTIGLTPITEADGLRDSFQYGSVTLTELDPNGTDAVSLQGDFELWNVPTTALQYIGFSLRCPAAVRSALTYAVDREAIISGDMDGFGTATVLAALPNSPWYQPELAGQAAYAPDKLKEVAESGTELTMVVNSANRQRTASAERVAEGLRACGLNVSLQKLTPKQYAEMLKTENFDLYYGEIRLSPNFDLSPIFRGGYGSFGKDPAIARLCESTLANSGNAYDLQNAILTDGLICPVAFQNNAVYAVRGLELPLHPNLNGWILCGE